jgi:hypothetical protein
MTATSKMVGKTSLFFLMINEMRCFDNNTAYVLCIVSMFPKAGLIPTVPLHYYCFAILFRNAFKFFPARG